MTIFIIYCVLFVLLIVSLSIKWIKEPNQKLSLAFRDAALCTAIFTLIVFLFETSVEQLLIGFLVSGIAITIVGIICVITGAILKRKATKNADDTKVEQMRMLTRKGWRMFLIVGIPSTIICIILFVGIILMFATALDTESQGQPSSIEFRDSHDLERITAVQFPDVQLVDSSYYRNFSLNETKVIFTVKKTDRKKLLQRIKRAAKNDAYWSGNSTEGWGYYILPDTTIEVFDRTKGHGYRMVDMDGDGIKESKDWDGTFISLGVTPKGDTIRVTYGWAR